MNIQQLKQYIFKNGLQSQILQALNLPNIREDDNKIQCCNIDGDNPTAILIYKNNENLLVTDHTRDISDKYNNNDIIALVEFVRNCDYGEATKWIKQVLHIEDSFAKEATEQDRINYILKNSKVVDDRIDNELLAEIPEETLKAYLPWDNTIFYEDHIDWETQAEFELGLDVFSHRITIPIRDEFGRLVGIKGRRAWDTVDELNPKYIYLKDCEKSKILYGLYKTLPYIQEKGEVIVCEAEKGVMQLWSYGYRNCVAVSGHNLSNWQVRRLEELDVDITIAFDKDVDIDVIEKELDKFETDHNLYYIYDENNLLDEKQSPMDEPNKWIDLYDYNSKCKKLYDKPKDDWEV